MGGAVGGEQQSVVCCARAHARTHGLVKSIEGAAGWRGRRRRRRTWLQTDGVEEGHVCRHLPKRVLAPRLWSSCKETVGHSVVLTELLVSLDSPVSES